MQLIDLFQNPGHAKTTKHGGTVVANFDMAKIKYYHNPRSGSGDIILCYDPAAIKSPDTVCGWLDPQGLFYVVWPSSNPFDAAMLIVEFAQIKTRSGFCQESSQDLYSNGFVRINNREAVLATGQDLLPKQQAFLVAAGFPMRATTGAFTIQEPSHEQQHIYPA